MFAFLFHWRSFSSWSWIFGISHRCFNFFMFSSDEIILRCLLSLALPLSPLSTSMKTLKSCRKKDSTLLLFFLPKSPGGHAICRKNARLVEMQNLTPAYMKGCTYVRTKFDDFLICVNYDEFPFLLHAPTCQ